MLNERSCAKSNPTCAAAKEGVPRRDFLTAGSAAVSTLLLGQIFPGRVAAQDAATAVQVATYPRIRIASRSEIQPGKPLEFDYPKEALHTTCLLMQLNHKAGGGVGAEQNIVAFSSRCTHMGGDLSEGFVSEHNVLGCSEHLTTFDLTRHGMVVAGHATQSLPQIILDMADDDIYATGIVGLLYGYDSNPTQS